MPTQESNHQRQSPVTEPNLPEEPKSKETQTNIKNMLEPKHITIKPANQDPEESQVRDKTQETKPTTPYKISIKLTKPKLNLHQNQPASPQKPNKAQ